MRTRLVLAVLPVALVGVTAASAMAAPKTMKGSYAATAIPDVTPNATGPCLSTLPGGQQYNEVKLPAAGKMKISMTGFQGDWDLCVYNAKGQLIGSSTGFVEATTETVQLKLKKAQTVTIGAANVGGTPTAQVSWNWTGNK